MRKSYPSDISRAQLETIKPLLERARTKTSPRRVDIYEEFPKWRTVHSYWTIWSEPQREGTSLLEQALGIAEQQRLISLLC